MTSTILFLLLPMATLLGFVFARHHLYVGLADELLILWILTALVCFLRGLFIRRYHRLLARCCFAVALLPIPFLIRDLVCLVIDLGSGPM